MIFNFFLFLFFAYGFSLIPCSAQGTWVQKTGMSTTGRFTAVAFAIGNKGYLGTGASFLDDFWEYNPLANTWTQKANFKGGIRSFSAGFSIGLKGYIGTGDSLGNKYNDLWEYDPITNSWLQCASIPGDPRAQAVSFSIGLKGYIGTGQRQDGSRLQDFWEYDPIVNSWTQKADFAGGARQDIDRAVFVIENKAYLGTGLGNANVYHKDFWEYDPVTNLWIRKTDFPGVPRYGATGFSVCGSGYLGLGCAGDLNVYSDFWKYTPATNSWVSVDSFPGGGRADQPSFVVNEKAYVGTGKGTANPWINDLWEFTPDPPTGVTAINSSSASICSGQIVTLTATGGSTYSWNTGETTNPIFISPSSTATYFVMASNVCGSGTTSVTITVLHPVNASIATSSNTICAGQSATLSAFGGTHYVWNTGETTNLILISPSSTTTYSVTASNLCGSDTVAVTITVSPPVNASITASADTICLGQTVTLSATGGGNYSWNTGSTTSAITVTPGTSTDYSVTVSMGACASTVYETITVNRRPIIAVSDITICTGETATLAASGDGTYLWSTGEITNSILVTPSSTTTYSLTVSNSCGSDTAFPLVSVFPSAVSQFSFITLDGDTCGSPTVQFTNNSINSNSWLWNFGDGNSSVLQYPTHSYSSPGTYYVILISNNSGCSDSSHQTVAVKTVHTLPLFIPNAFSPNGDNENDFFILQGTECMKKFSLVIYNRWGEKVFKTIHQSKGWDGTFHGKKENSGVYTYYLDAILTSGEVIRKKGNVTLVR